jgi:hypothetical protein
MSSSKNNIFHLFRFNFFMELNFSICSISCRPTESIESSRSTPHRVSDYHAPAELFDVFLDEAYAINSIS